MIQIRSPESETETIRQPELPMRRWLLRDFRAFARPDPFHARRLHLPPPVDAQQSRHLPILIAAELTGQTDDCCYQWSFIIERDCPNTRHTRRSARPSVTQRRSTICSRRARPSSFSPPLPSESIYRRSLPSPPGSTGCSPVPVPSTAWPDRPLSHRTRCVTDS